MRTEPRFSATCPDCGDVELAAEQLWLVVATASVTTTATASAPSHFDFFCPGCGAHVSHFADQATVAVLAQLIPVEEMHIPAEALEEHEGSALTMDDLIDLMLSLESPLTAAA